MVFVFSVKSDFRYSLFHFTTLAVPLSGLQTTRRKYYPSQPDFIRLFLYPLRVSFNFVLFREYQKQPPYLLQIHPCIAFLFSNSHCMQFARLCNCPQSIKLLEIMPQNIKLLVKSARFATESLYSQNKKPSTQKDERHIFLQDGYACAASVFLPLYKAATISTASSIEWHW